MTNDTRDRIYDTLFNSTFFPSRAHSKQQNTKFIYNKKQTNKQTTNTSDNGTNAILNPLQQKMCQNDRNKVHHSSDK